MPGSSPTLLLSTTHQQRKKKSAQRCDHADEAPRAVDRFTVNESFGRRQHLRIETRAVGADLTHPASARGLCAFDDSGSGLAEPLCGWSALLSRQRLEAGDHIKQFLVDASLAQTMEGSVEVFQQFVDVLVGALHRR